MNRLNSAQMRALHSVYERRHQQAKAALSAASAELTEIRERVEMHENNIKNLTSKLIEQQKVSSDDSLEMIQHRERVIYWLNYDLEDVRFSIGNAKVTLKEKQSAYDSARNVVNAIQTKLDNLETQKIHSKRQKERKQERVDDESYEDMFAGIRHAR